MIDYAASRGDADEAKQGWMDERENRDRGERGLCASKRVNHKNKKKVKKGAPTAQRACASHINAKPSPMGCISSNDLWDSIVVVLYP